MSIRFKVLGCTRRVQTARGYLSGEIFHRNDVVIIIIFSILMLWVSTWDKQNSKTPVTLKIQSEILKVSVSNSRSWQWYHRNKNLYYYCWMQLDRGRETTFLQVTLDFFSIFQQCVIRSSWLYIWIIGKIVLFIHKRSQIIHFRC